MILDRLRERLIDDWRNVLWRAWSIRLAAFWGGVSMLALLWPALIDLPRWFYLGGGVALGVAIGIARVTKQDGLND